jgi:hypothetical protein
MHSAGAELKVDRRTAAKVAAQVRDRLPHHVPGWKPHEKGPAEALIRIFGRFCELIINRLNQAPEKNFLAFLDLLGASPLPPQPARVPLTFYLAQKAEGATVPERTQVAAPPAAGEKDPVIFETEQELQVTAANLDSLYVKDPIHDTYTDGSKLLPSAAPSTGQAAVEPSLLSAFRGDKPIPHILYLGLKLPSPCPTLKQVRLGFGIEGGPAASAAGRSVAWEAVQKAPPPPAAGASPSTVPEDERFTVIPLKPSSDTTADLTKNGDVVFDNFVPVPEVEVNGVQSQWLRCRFLTPPEKETHLPAAAPAPESRTLKSVSVHIEIERSGLQIEQAFANAVAIDLSKEFLPFGVRPKLGDTFYLASAEAFSLANSTVTLHFDLVNPASRTTEPSIPAAQPRGIKLVWEFWDGQAWARLGTSQPKGVTGIHDVAAGFSDDTEAISETGDVTFKFPSVPQQTIVNGQKNRWVRVRIAGGDYGEEAHLERDPAKWDKDNPAKMVVPATLAPPIVAAANVHYVLASDSVPEAVLSYEDFRYITAPAARPGLRLLQPIDGTGPALYLGFNEPASQSLASSNLTVYFGLANAPGSKVTSSPLPLNLKAVLWEYWSGISQRWTQFTVRDGTNGFRGSGTIPFLTPPDFLPREEFGRERHWLRVVRSDNTSDFDPTLASVLLNTTMAVQAVTVANEVLGSSNGKPDQIFHTIHSPVLEGQILQVLEPTMPSVEATELIKGEEGEDAVSPLMNPFSKREEIWVRWHLVDKFDASGPQNRHYFLNRLTGEVKFGDGEHGRIPPALAGNVRMKYYRSGGGTRGNQPPNSIKQLRTTIPFIERAENLVGASGGADAESRSALLDRAPRGVRHGRRAVTAEDFEDLTFLASPAAGRVRCVPLRDLAADPDAERQVPGVISLIVVPRSSDPKPLPSLELCDRIRDFLDGHRLLTADLVLVSPDYVAIRVETELAVTDPNSASDVERAASHELRRFLHPLTGGTGSGWDFGQLPAESDLYARLEGVRGVSHVRRLTIVRIPDRPGGEATSRFLICSGDPHKVTVTLEE